MQTDLKLTYEDYLLIPEDGRRHEIIDGEAHVSPAPTTPHQRAVLRLSAYLFQHLQHTRAGEVFVAPTDVILSDTDIVQPDVLFIASKHSNRIQERGIEGPPDLAVEVLSEGSRRHDEIRKRKLYARHGVLEYWIVDPDLETVKVYRLADAIYARAAELSREDEDVLRTPLLPGFSLALAQLFA